MRDGVKNTVSYYYNKYNCYGVMSYNDKISGYTIKQLEDAIRGAKDFNLWENNIKNKYENETEKYLYEAFNYWD